MSTQLVQISPVTLPALVAAAGEHAGMRFLEFFGPTSATRTRFAPRSGAGSGGGLETVGKHCAVRSPVTAASRSDLVIG
jgi:hypothetical protein